MFHEFINYNTLYGNINVEINKFCLKYEIEFEKQKIKTKRELLIHYSLLEILKELENIKCRYPVLLYNSNFKNNLFEFCFKQISKILVLPVFFVENESSNGNIIELSLKSESFYNKNTFTMKKLKKYLCSKKQYFLIEKIYNFKCFAKHHDLENIH
jgi:hypothetical protein